MSSKRKLVMPTLEEDVAINAGIAEDPSTYELNAEEFRQLRRLGRPPKAQPKVAVTIRYDQEVIDAFKAGGPGWQTRMNDALRQWLQEHRAG